ncbi:unnamed protein product [Closterium sp. NIES-53]
MQNVAIFDLDFDAILAAMYAVTDSAEGDCYRCVPPGPGIEAAALGASESAAPGTSESAAPDTSEFAAPGAGESALSGTAPTEALHTFTLDSSASRSFFCDSTTLTPLSRPIAISLTDPSGGPVLAHSSTVLLCQRVTHCTCSRTGRHLATFTRRPGSSLYTLTTASPPDTASGQVAAFGQVFSAAFRSSPASAPCLCHPLSHETLLWHHRLGHPSLPRLRGMASRTLVSGLPRSLPPLLPGPAPTCVLCVEGRQQAAPHSSEFPLTEAPLQTLHMYVWCEDLGSTRVSGQGHERYFLLVVDDYSRYTTVFPLRRKDRGGEFFSDLRRAFCRAEGIRQTFTLPASPQQNGIAECRIGMVMDVARTSMIHAAAPHFLWPFVVQYAAHQINLQPRVSLPETTPTLRWTGKLSSHAVPCVFLGFPLDAPGWQFYHPTSRRVLSSQDVTFDKLVSYYRVSQIDPVEPVKVAVDSGAARGADPAGAGPWGAEPGVSESEGAEPRGADLERVEPAGAEPGGAESGGAELGCAEPERADSGGTGTVGGPTGVGAAGGAGAAGPGGARSGGTGAVGTGGGAGVGAVGAGAVATGGAAGAGAAGGTGAGGAAGVVAGDPGAEGTGAVSAVSGGAARPRPYYVQLLQQVLGVPPSTSPTPPLLSPPPVQSQSQLQPASPLPGPSPYSGLTRGLTEPREPESCPASSESRPVSPESRPESRVHAICTGRCVPRQRPPPDPGTHSMTLYPSTAPQRVPLPSPPASALPDGPDCQTYICYGLFRL